MENFFLKLGLMTQKNHAELIQEIKALRESVDALNEKISESTKDSVANNAKIKNSLAGITDKLYAFADSAASNHAEVAANLSALTKGATANHAELAKKISALTKDSTANHAEVEDSLANLIGKISALIAASNANKSFVTEKIVALSNKIIADNQTEKETLENMEELIRLMFANQVMNLAEK